MTIKVYVTPSCMYCFTLKEFLKEKNISFEEIDVSKDSALADDLAKRSGQMNVPVLDIDGQIIVGFDREKITKLLGI